jgi:hypothetical protein
MNNKAIPVNITNVMISYRENCSFIFNCCLSIRYFGRNFKSCIVVENYCNSANKFKTADNTVYDFIISDLRSQGASN